MKRVRKKIAIKYLSNEIYLSFNFPFARLNIVQYGILFLLFFLYPYPSHFHYYIFFTFVLFYFVFHFDFIIVFILDPVVDSIDENLLNLAYSDQDDDGDDEKMGIENRICCKGIYVGSQQDEDQIRERILWQLWLMSFPIN